MAESIFNLDNLRKAVQTYKTNKTASTSGSAPGEIAGMMAGVPNPTVQSNGLPQAAITAANNVRSGNVATAVPPAATAAAKRMVATTSQPRTEQALSAQSNLVNTPFTFNAETDPSYQAALRAAQQNLQVNQKNTNAQLRATGQGKSSYSETVANQLANQSAENVANNILPIYAQQAYQQYQDSIGNQRNLYQDYNQQDFQNPITESQVTGNYMPAEAKQAIQNLLGLKAQAETKGITKDTRTQLSTEADAIRAQLKALGIDPSFYGADKTAAQASVNNPGIRTLAGQAQDQSVKNANLDAATTVANTTGRAVTPQSDWQGLYRQAADPNTPLTANQQQQVEAVSYQKARDAISDQRWKTEFDENVRQNGLSFGLQQLSQRDDQSYRQAQLALSQDENSRAWLNYENDLNGTAEPAKYNGMSASQVYDALKPDYIKTDNLGKPVPLTTAEKDGLYQRVMSLNLPDGQDTQVMSLLGLSPTEIATYDKQYLGE